MILEIDGVNFSYATRKLLSSIYLKCETGKITGILGRNGCGKSTLLRILFGTIPCESASIRIDGGYIPQPVFSSMKVSYLPQETFIPPHYRLDRILKLYEVKPDAIIISFPEIADCLTYQISELSGGLQRLFEVLLIVNSTAGICLLDEPFTGLAPALIERLCEFFIEHKKNKGIVITDHLYRQVMGVSDDLSVLSNGTIYPVKDRSTLVLYGYLPE